MFCKSLRYVLQKILKSVLKTCWEDFCKSTRKLPAKILKGVFCKNTDTSSAKALRIVLQKYGEVLCRNTEGYSTKILNAVIRNFRGEFQPQNNWLSCKKSDTWSVSCHTMTQIFGTYSNTRKVVQETGQNKRWTGWCYYIEWCPPLRQYCFFEEKSCLWFKGQIHINLSLVEIVFPCFEFVKITKTSPIIKIDFGTDILGKPLALQSISCFKAVKVFSSWLNEKLSIALSYLYHGSSVTFCLVICHG